jgi:hypothetical protein
LQYLSVIILRSFQRFLNLIFRANDDTNLRSDYQYKKKILPPIVSWFGVLIIP